MTQRYEVKQHRGRSGLSVYEWRVYSVISQPVNRTIRTQLAKYRTERPARSFLEKLEYHAAIVAAKGVHNDPNHR